ncbi:MAG: Hsp20/alpha crystallin family protein [Saprospiraceae bacterium]
MTKLEKYYGVPSTKNLFGSLLDEFFNKDLNTFIGSDMGFVSVPVNVLESEDNFTLEMAVPGYEKGDFALNVNGKNLEIKAKHESKEEVNDKRFTRREFHVASFTRQFTLPDSVNPNEVSAVYEQGVLKVVLPKNEDAKPIVKTIEIGG